MSRSLNRSAVRRLGRALVLAALLSAPPSSFADTTWIYDSQKVKTQEPYGLCVDDCYSATWGFWCDFTSFTAQSPPPQISPDASDPGPSDLNDIMSFPNCWMDCSGAGEGCSASSIQCCADFDFRFDSLHDLGVWVITCDGIGANPVWCNGTCTPNCDAGALFDLDPLIYTITVWNDPPTASISHSPTPAWNATVTLDANSSDPDGGSVTHDWSITGRPPGSSTDLSSSSSETPTIAFGSDDDIGHWSFQVHVDDGEGERRSFFHSFDVPNVPPDITITGATDVDAMQPIELAVTPTDDVDGGALTFSWDIASSPPGASIGPSSGYATSSSLSIPTTGIDIGSWTFEVTATDNEGDTDTDTHTVEVHNLPPEIHFAGDTSLVVGDTVAIETTFTEDLDGGAPLEFHWDIVQAPVGAVPGLAADYSTTATLSFATGESEAGTWVFELTVIDDEGDDVTDTYSVFVDGPVYADVFGTDVVSYDDFPLVLDGGASWDTDSDCELDPSDHCHETDGRPVAGITPGVVTYTWFVSDAPYDSGLWPGRVDEVFGIAGTGSSVSFSVLDIPHGQWGFELEVVDAEGNTDWTSHQVWILDPNTEPMLWLTPPARYTTNPAGLLDHDVAVFAAAWDLDNLLFGETFGVGLGILDYQWNVVAPAGCTPPAPPTGPTGDIYAMYSAGSAVLPACQGVWSLEVTVEDDDSPALTATDTTQVIIGNCPTVLCIDAPTTSFPAYVDFADDTDISIVYHLDSAAYDDPLFAFGLFAQVHIFHQSDPLTPVYSAWDPNLLGSDKGSFLTFHWDGWTDARERPETGFYSVEIDLWDAVLSLTSFTAAQPDSIWISVAEVEIVSATDFIDRDELSTGLDLVAVDYQVTGGVTIDDVVVRIRDAGDTLVYEESMGNAAAGSFSWNGDTGGGSILPAGVYTATVVALSSTSELGQSAPHEFVVYLLDLLPVTGDLGLSPPEQFVALNGDDDDLSGTVDHADVGPAAGEDELEQIEILFQPLGASGTLRLSAASGGANVRLFESPDKTSELLLPAEWNLASEVPPWSLYAEGVAAGDTELELELEDAAATSVDSRSLTLHVSPVDLDLDTDMDGTVDLTDDGLEMQDKAIIIDVNNDNDGGGIDSHDNVVNGAADLAELTQLTLRQMHFVPAGGSVRLDITDAESTPAVNKAKEKIRIFDHLQTGRIGPPAADGGPDQHEYTVPVADITGGDLVYFIECFNHGNVTIRLTVLDAASNELASDELKVVLNVDRTPAGGTTRFYVGGSHDHPTTTLEGIRGRIATPQAKLNWNPTLRQLSSSNVWVSTQDMGTAAGDFWIQTGMSVDRHAGTAVTATTAGVYFEVSVFFGTGAQVHYLQIRPGGTWPANALLSAAVENLATGQVVARVDGTQWDTFTHAEWQTRKLNNYQASSELFNSVDQNPGTAASHCAVSDIEVMDGGAWAATAFVAGDFEIEDYDKNGNHFNPATSHEWAYGAVGAQSFEMWDLVVEY